jgi:hypothetical protein
MELSDEELYAAAQEVEWDTEDDDETLDKMAMEFEARARLTTLDATGEAMQRIHDLMNSPPRRHMREVYSEIDDVLGVDRFPDPHLEIFYGVRPLTRNNRYLMMSLAWANGLYPELFIEWFRHLGSFCGKPQREGECRNLVKDFDTKMDSPKGRQQLAKWRVFSFDTMQWESMYTPQDKLLMLQKSMDMFTGRDQFRYSFSHEWSDDDFM